MRNRRWIRFQLVQTRVSQIRNLARSQNETERAVALQEQRVKFGEWQVELYSDRWENGEIIILELIRSQNDLENSKVQVVNQKTTYMELLAEYRFAVGR